MIRGAQIQGLRSFGESSVLICGTARNVSRKLDNFVLSTEKSFLGFKKTEYLICESFSSDGTWDKLQSLMFKRNDFHCLQDLEIDKSELRRTVRIASARNKLQNTIKRNFKDFDYVVMMDLDGVNRNLTKKSVELCWRHSQWDVVTANQPLRYYDVWALRATDWCETDCWQEYAGLLEEMSHKQALKTAVTSKMRSIRSSNPPIPVQSAFGGLAIYKMEAFLSSEYVGEDEEGMEICEHVPFHKGLSDKGFKIFIMPSLVNLSPITQIGNIMKDLVLKFIGVSHKMFIQVKSRH